MRCSPIAFSGCFHYRNRCVHDGAQYFLADLRGFEDAAVADDLVDCNMFLLQDIHADLHRSESGEEVHAHEVGR